MPDTLRTAIGAADSERDDYGGDAEEAEGMMWAEESRFYFFKGAHQQHQQQRTPDPAVAKGTPPRVEGYEANGDASRQSLRQADAGGGCDKPRGSSSSQGQEPDPGAQGARQKDEEMSPTSVSMRSLAEWQEAEDQQELDGAVALRDSLQTQVME